MSGHNNSFTLTKRKTCYTIVKRVENKYSSTINKGVNKNNWRFWITIFNYYIR